MSNLDWSNLSAGNGLDWSRIEMPRTTAYDRMRESLTRATASAEKASELAKQKSSLFSQGAKPIPMPTPAPLAPSQAATQQLGGKAKIDNPFGSLDLKLKPDNVPITGKIFDYEMPEFEAPKPPTPQDYAREALNLLMDAAGATSKITQMTAAVATIPIGLYMSNVLELADYLTDKDARFTKQGTKELLDRIAKSNIGAAKDQLGLARDILINEPGYLRDKLANDYLKNKTEVTAGDIGVLTTIYMMDLFSDPLWLVGEKSFQEALRWKKTGSITLTKATPEANLLKGKVGLEQKVANFFAKKPTPIDVALKGNPNAKFKFKYGGEGKLIIEGFVKRGAKPLAETPEIIRVVSEATGKQIIPNIKGNDLILSAGKQSLQFGNQGSAIGGAFANMEKLIGESVKPSIKPTEVVKPTPAPTPTPEAVKPTSLSKELISEAKKYDTAEEFASDYSIGTAGIKFHITDNPNFKIRNDIIPSDVTYGRGTSKVLSPAEFEKQLAHEIEIFRKNNIKTEPEISRYIEAQGKKYKETGGGGGLMVTKDIEPWIEPNTLSGDRKYVAIISTSKVPLKDIIDSTRGFGNEIFIKNPQNAEVLNVVPIEDALKIQENFKLKSREEAINLWNEAHKTPTTPKPKGTALKPPADKVSAKPPADKAAAKPDIDKAKDLANKAAAKPDIDKAKDLANKAAAKDLSLHYEKVKARYGWADDEGVPIKRQTELDQKKKSFRLIQDNPDKALRLGYGMEDFPKDLNPSVFRAALIASLEDAGKITLAKDIGKIQSASLSKAGQDLAFGKVGLGEKITANITEGRLKKIGKNLSSDKPIEAAQKKIKEAAKKSAGKVRSAQAKGVDPKKIDELINSIIC